MTATIDIDARHDAIASTRQRAARALYRTLRHAEPSATESTLHHRWQSELHTVASVMPGGWYQPPPTGMSVLVGQPPHFHRTAFRTLRDPVNHPRSDNALTGESLLFVYCSPIDRTTAMIGDFQVTMYAGSEPAIRDHLRLTYEVSLATAAAAQPGMQLRDVYYAGERIMRLAGVRNDAASTTDGSGLPNVGHTIPWSDEDYDPAIWPALVSANMREVARVVRNAIHLITPQQRRLIGPDTALTIEPQVVSRHGIQTSFHLIVRFRAGIKTVHADFDDLFDLFGMREYVTTDLG